MPPARMTPKSASATSPRHVRGGAPSAMSEERVDERRHAGDLTDHEQRTDQQQRQDEWDQPPEATGPEEVHQLANCPCSRRYIPKNSHRLPFKMIVRSNTSASRPLRENVEKASAGVLTIGSPRRLN